MCALSILKKSGSWRPERCKEYPQHPMYQTQSRVTYVFVSCFLIDSGFFVPSKINYSTLVTLRREISKLLVAEAVCFPALVFDLRTLVRKPYVS